MVAPCRRGSLLNADLKVLCKRQFAPLRRQLRPQECGRGPRERLRREGMGPCAKSDEHAGRRQRLIARRAESLRVRGEGDGARPGYTGV